MTDTGDAKQVKNKKSRYQLIKQREQEELRSVLDSFNGRAVIWRILNHCSLFHAAPGNKDEAYRQAGRRDIGLEIIKTLDEVNKTAYSIMANEAVSRDTLTDKED